MRDRVAHVAVVGLMCAGLVAEVSAAEDVEELQALMALLEEETELATRSRMNTDYVPGMMTVLHARDAALQGMTTVEEALSLVTGFHMTQGNSNQSSAVVRGIGATLNTSNLKLMLDGIAVNRAVDASADWLLRMPLNQVERIEVIRGPGAALYGEFAFSGVVNVIQRSDRSVRVIGGSQDRRQVDAHFRNSDTSVADVRLNTSAWRLGNSGLETNEDNFYRSGYSHSPGTVYDHEKGQITSLSASRSDYHLQAYYAWSEQGPGYGYLGALPYEGQPREESALGVSLGKSWDLSADLKLELQLLHQQTKLHEAAYIPIPAGVRPPGGGEPVPQDEFRQYGNRDRTDRLNTRLHWQATPAHQLYMDLGYAYSRVEDSFLYFEVEGEPVRVSPDERVPVVSGSERSLVSLAVQDQWQVSESLELTLGARYDHYDDWGSHFSPRLASVWRAGEHHIVKLQFAEAFRPPTLEERYPGPESRLFRGSEQLQEERLRSAEAVYIYRRARHTLRSTYFYSQVRDLIEFYLRPGEAPYWRNRGNIDSQGLELEWRQIISRQWEWQANLAYTQAEDHLDDDDRLVGSVDWLANLIITWHAAHHLQHSLHVRYVGEQEGWELATAQPPVDRFDDYILVDYSLGLSQLFGVPELKLTLALNNLTDEHYNSVPSPSQYPEGLPQGQRSGWMGVAYAF